MSALGKMTNAHGSSTEGSPRSLHLSAREATAHGSYVTQAAWDFVKEMWLGGGGAKCSIRCNFCHSDILATSLPPCPASDCIQGISGYLHIHAGPLLP